MFFDGFGQIRMTGLLTLAFVVATGCQIFAESPAMGGGNGLAQFADVLPNSVFQPYASVATNLLFFSKGKPTQAIWYWQHRLPEGVKAYSKTKPIQKTEFEHLKAWWHNRVENEQAWKVSLDDLKANNYSLDIKNPHVAEVEHRYSSAELLNLLHDSFAKSDSLLNQLQQELGQ